MHLFGRIQISWRKLSFTYEKLASKKMNIINNSVPDMFSVPHYSRAFFTKKGYPYVWSLKLRTIYSINIDFLWSFESTDILFYVLLHRILHTHTHKVCLSCTVPLVIYLLLLMAVWKLWRKEKTLAVDYLVWIKSYIYFQCRLVWF